MTLFYRMDFNNHRVRRIYREFLKGKKVALVGPSASIIGQGNGTLIDSYDVVIRLNNALPIPSELHEDLGSKTDVLYSNLLPDNCGKNLAPLLKKSHVKFVIGAYPPLSDINGTPLRLKTDTQEFYKMHRHTFRSFGYFDSHYFKKLWKIMGLPNTGTSAILDLLKSGLKELYITGLTFFHDGYYPEYKKWSHEETLKEIQTSGLHQIDAQWTYMRNILASDPRIVVDLPLGKILSHFSDKPKIATLSAPTIETKTNSQNISLVQSPSVTKIDLSKISKEKNLTDQTSEPDTESDLNSEPTSKFQKAIQRRRSRIESIKAQRKANAEMKKNYYLRKKQTRQKLEMRKRQAVNPKKNIKIVQEKEEHHTIIQQLPISVNLFSTA